jgi:acetate---CoA ligase (ADP-forming)
MDHPSDHPSAHPLTAVFEPDSVAVIGASADPTKRGHQVLVALRDAGFQGTVFPVNPKECSPDS